MSRQGGGGKRDSPLTRNLRPCPLPAFFERKQNGTPPAVGEWYRGWGQEQGYVTRGLRRNLSFALAVWGQYRYSRRMNIKTAQAAIKAILAAIPDGELPDFDRIEHGPDGRVTAWWGGTGHILGSATRGGKRRPKNYRDRGAWDAIEGEMTYRADKRLLDNGDDTAGFTGKVAQ